MCEVCDKIKGYIRERILPDFPECNERTEAERLAFVFAIAALNGSAAEVALASHLYAGILLQLWCPPDAERLLGKLQGLALFAFETERNFHREVREKGDNTQETPVVPMAEMVEKGRAN